MSENMSQPSAAPAPPSAQEQIDAVMNLGPQAREDHPYWNERHPQHKDAVDAMFTLRQQEAAKDAGQVAADRVDGFAPFLPDAAPVPAGTPDSGLGQSVFPDAIPAPVRQVWTSIATEVGLGGRELSSIARTAVPYLEDSRPYDYETGLQALTDQLGDKAPAALRDAKALIEEYPGLLRVLEQRKLGSHPGVVRVLAERYQAREALKARLQAIQKDPEYLQLHGEHDHDKHRKLVDEAASILEALHG